MSAPEDYEESTLKEAILTLKDSSLEYLQSKSELASIEAKEAADYATKKLVFGVVAGFFGIASYVLFLILANSLTLSFADALLEKISQTIPLSPQQIVLLLFLLIHLIVVGIALSKLKDKSPVELFALTKSELKKDKQWLREMNNSAS